jgi:hypothetical protein
MARQHADEAVRLYQQVVDNDTHGGFWRPSLNRARLVRQHLSSTSTNTPEIDLLEPEPEDRADELNNTERIETITEDGASYEWKPNSGPDGFILKTERRY